MLYCLKNKCKGRAWLLSAFLWYTLECVVRLHERLRPLPPSHCLTSHSPTLTSVNRCAGCDVTEVGHVPLGWLRTIYYSVDHRERWCGGLWGSSRPQISVPAFSLCHFPKMWVSLVNTLNPRPKQHIMASCSVGNRLQLKRLGKRVRLYFISAQQSGGFAVELFGCRDNMLAVLLTKLNYLLRLGNVLSSHQGW